MATLSLGGTLTEKFTAIATAGFDGVELVENDLVTYSGTPLDVKYMADDLGLVITLLQPFRDFEGMPRFERERNFERLKQKFERMNHLGTDLLLVCSNVSITSMSGIDRAAEDFYRLGELAKTYGVRVGFEALPWGRHIRHYQDAWEVVRRANHPAIGLILDSFHLLASGQNLSGILSIPAEKIFLAQLADAPLRNADMVTWSRHFRTFPAWGQLPVCDFISILHTNGFNGCYSLEISNDAFKTMPATQIATDGFRSLRALLKQTIRQPVKSFYSHPVP